jgi:hypothetical protein
VAVGKKKAKIGDICEISTSLGLYYIQYTHDGLGMGQLVRVLPGRFSVRPINFAELAREKEVYFVFYTLDSELRNNQTKVVSNQPVPHWAQPYPRMRWQGGYDKDGRTTSWKIFLASDPLTLESHRRTPVIHDLTCEQRKLSIHQLWPHSVLVKELDRGWTPERAEELKMKDGG